MKSLVLPLGTAATGLLAGLYLAFSLAVLPGLRGVSDATFVVTMQRVNVAIVNPLFLLLFFGSPLLMALAVAIGPERRWTAVAAGLAVLALVLTVAVNVPLNDKLAAAGSSDPAAARAAFENTWTVFHTIRTVALVGSMSAALVGLVKVSSTL